MAYSDGNESLTDKVAKEIIGLDPGCLAPNGYFTKLVMNPESGAPSSREAIPGNDVRVSKHTDIGEMVVLLVRNAGI